MKMNQLKLVLRSHNIDNQTHFKKTISDFCRHKTVLLYHLRQYVT